MRPRAEPVYGQEGGGVARAALADGQGGRGLSQGMVKGGVGPRAEKVYGQGGVRPRAEPVDRQEGGGWRELRQRMVRGDEG